MSIDKTLFLDCHPEVFAELSTAGYGRTADVNLARNGDVIDVEVRCPNSGLLSVILRWANPFGSIEKVLGDAWERGYGDFGWKKPHPDTWHPWYAVIHSQESTAAVGVRTQCRSLASWSLSRGHIELHLDLRCGNRPVMLGDRSILGAQIVCGTAPDASVFEFLRSFCRHMCPTPRLAHEPVFGANDWYYAYGNNTGDRIAADSERVSEWCGSSSIWPFSVIDAGWQLNGGCEAGPWRGNERFGEMDQLAERIRQTGCRPGLWIRPLKTGLDQPGLMRKDTIDPSLPENLETVKNQIAKCCSWGFELIKHDFTTFDITGRWGFEMTDDVFDEAESFADDTRTSAEIVLDLYQAIREGAGDALLIGCNTFGHLAAGTHEIQRIGDDTSGQEWERTRKMGINSLAFRGAQQGAFFAADADCVGITKQIPWSLNRQWLDLLARSGTPLLVSADSDALDAEVTADLKSAFALASQQLDLIEPLDWLEQQIPTTWRSGTERVEYRWEDVRPVDTSE